MTYLSLHFKLFRNIFKNFPKLSHFRSVFFGKMGNESSTMVDESVPPETLKSRDLKGVADYVKSGRVKKIVVMVCNTFRYELFRE